MADLSLQIAAKILNKELTPDAHEALIDSYIESLGKKQMKLDKYTVGKRYGKAFV